MNVKTRKPDLQAQFMDAELVEAKRWRNVSFTRTGRTIYGSMTHPTKQRALEVARKTISEALEELEIVEITTVESNALSSEDFPMTVIQIPSIN